jgi:hypothetical protein
MILNKSSEIKKVLIGYQFHFGIGIHSGTRILDCTDGVPCALMNISKGCYRSSNNSTHKCNRQPDRQIEEIQIKNLDEYIASYNVNVLRRIRTTFRGIRDSLNIKLDEVDISKLTIETKAIKVSQNTNVTLNGIVSIQNIGVGTISLWLEAYIPETEQEWLNVCDPALVSFNLEHTNMTRTAWSLSDFVRLLILKCHKTVNSSIIFPSNLENNEIIKDWTSFKKYLTYMYKKINDTPISYDVESYPIVFLHYDFDVKTLDTLFQSSKEIADCRLVLYNDIHWKFKSDDVIENTVNSVDVSTRNSIRWLVTTQGTLKICSRELEQETSVSESYTAALIEIDLILTMRFFLVSIMQNLSNISKKSTEPIEVAEMKEQIFVTMDKYFNINISQNDQTIKRIEKFKKIFHVTETYQNVTDRMEVFSVKISNENSAIIGKQQSLRTIIFGLFGSLQVLYPFFQKLFEKTSISNVSIFLVSLGASIIIASAIYIVVKKFKLKGRK